MISIQDIFCIVFLCKCALKEFEWQNLCYVRLVSRYLSVRNTIGSIFFLKLYERFTKPLVAGIQRALRAWFRWLATRDWVTKIKYSFLSAHSSAFWSVPPFDWCSLSDQRHSLEHFFDKNYSMLHNGQESPVLLKRTQCKWNQGEYFVPHRRRPVTPKNKAHYWAKLNSARSKVSNHYWIVKRADKRGSSGLFVSACPKSFNLSSKKPESEIRL